ncbi:MAG: RHS repeat-associated core domain-containing protein [Pirellulaceae bacterium]
MSTRCQKGVSYYTRHRVYHPQLGRFVSRDPIGYAANEWNLDEFVASNPINLVDPFGDVWHHLFPWQFQDEFNDLNIDINSPMFGWDLPPEDHAKLHPLWNEEWESIPLTYFDPARLT